VNGKSKRRKAKADGEVEDQSAGARHLAGELARRAFSGAPSARVANCKRQNLGVASLAAPLAGRVLAVLVVGLMLSAAFAAEPAAKPADETATRIFDTCQSPEKYEAEQVVAGKGWEAVPEDALAHEFKGDVALCNSHLTVILGRRQDAGAAIFTKRADRKVSSAEVRPAALKGLSPVGKPALRIVENSGGAVKVSATCPAGIGHRMEIAYRLVTGQPALEIQPGEGVASVVVSEVSCWHVVADYFGDDVAYYWESLPPRLPVDNMVIGLRPGFPLIMLLGSFGAQGIRVPQEGKNNPFGMNWQAPATKQKSMWVAVVEYPAPSPVTWFDSKQSPGALQWSAPFGAKWRGDLVPKNAACQSTTAEDLADKIKACASLEKGWVFLVYPLDRTRATPLDVFTPMDIMRNTLGVGPCQYVLDAEGLSGGEAATPAFVMDWVEKQLKKKKVDADEARERLKAMTEHVGRTHARIKKYADFAEEVNVRLTAGTPAAKPSADEAAAMEKLRATVADMKASAEAGLAATVPDKVTKPADEIAGLVGKDDAAAKAAGPVAEVRAVGAAEDRALAKCRMATRWLRCQCLDIAEGDVARKAPALAELAKKIEARAGEMLQGK